ncbi:FUSC family protein [Aquabacter sp. P-9]|uniref:FUSC family protein n=1 Tax=Aquabacter sediminis TaxID=3029197 RepID=UPI00237E2049|nr:FUSC family protein [Aquabacter sp. P-9]MDE1568162.1 FUSC family protein [Aquabacter sp. P-9]
MERTGQGGREAKVTRWPARVRLLAADLLVFDARRLHWALAARGMAGLLVPLLLAHALPWPDLVWTGIGAFLIAIGDCMDDGDRRQALRILAGTVLGALALATGILAGGSLPFAVAGMFAWGIIAALMGAYGAAFGVMALPVAWAYVQMGLPATDHSLVRAGTLAAYFALGGLLTLGLTLALPLGRPRTVLDRQVAGCFRLLARYMAGEAAEGPETPEARMRAAIAEARRVALEMRPDGGTRETRGLALALIAHADQMFSLTSALRVSGGDVPPDMASAISRMAAAIETHRIPADLVPPLPAPGETVSDLGGDRARALEARLRSTLRASILLLNGAPDASGPVDGPAQQPSAVGLLAPLRPVLDWRTPLARHALRYGVVTAAAVVVFWLFPRPFGYWVPLTVTVVLKPTAALTVLRALQRVGGTLLGLGIGLLAMPWLTDLTLQLAFASTCFTLLLAVLPLNYGLAIVFLSAGLIPYEHVLFPGIDQDLGALRLLATLIGAGLALLGCHLLWPSYEHRGVPALLSAACAAMADYANGVLARLEGCESADVLEGRRRAGDAMSALQGALRRGLTEIGGDGPTLARIAEASHRLQALFIGLNGLMQAEVETPLDPAFRPAFTFRLASACTAEAVTAPLPAAMGTGPLAARLEDLVRTLDALQAVAQAVPRRP